MKKFLFNKHVGTNGQKGATLLWDWDDTDKKFRNGITHFGANFDSINLCKVLSFLTEEKVTLTYCLSTNTDIYYIQNVGIFAIEAESEDVVHLLKYVGGESCDPNGNTI